MWWSLTVIPAAPLDQPQGQLSYHFNGGGSVLSKTVPTPTGDAALISLHASALNHGHPHPGPAATGGHVPVDMYNPFATAPFGLALQPMFGQVPPFHPLVRSPRI